MTAAAASAIALAAPAARVSRACGHVYCHIHSLFVDHRCTHHHAHTYGHGLRPARGSLPAARPAPAHPAKTEAGPPKMLAEAAEEEAGGTDVGERQVGGEICRRMDKNNFRKDSPVPHFCLYFVLTPKYGRYS